MPAAVESLKLDRLLVVCPGDRTWPLSDRITVRPLHRVPESFQ